MSRLLFLLVIATPASAAEREFAPLPRPVTSFGAAVSDGFVYVYGGHSGKAHTYSTETTLGQLVRLNLGKPAKWEELPGGPILQGLALVAHDGLIYRIGGMQPKNKANEEGDTYSVASFARYDPKGQRWEELTSLPEGRSSHDAVVIGDKIFVAGGWAMQGGKKDPIWHSNALMLDLKRQPMKWESFEQPFKRRALTLAAHDDKVFVIAGLDPDGNMERTVNVYDPDKKTWSKSVDIPKGSMNGFTPAACDCDGRLYLSPYDGNVYGFDDKGAAWETVGALKLPRLVHRLVPIGKNQMLAIGGSAKGPVANVELVVPTK
jgi:N-acetylneuraminic acid mutarotase